jgi:hypothetical protein
MTDPSRIAKLIRMLSSDNDAEVLTAAKMLKKLTNLVELGDQIERGPSGTSEREKQIIRNAAYQSGLQDGIKKGHRNARPHKPFDVGDDVHNDNNPLDMVSFCIDRRSVLNKKERDFIDSILYRLDTTGYLSEKQRKWLSDIYDRIGGK